MPGPEGEFQGYSTVAPFLTAPTVTTVPPIRPARQSPKCLPSITTTTFSTWGPRPKRMVCMAIKRPTARAAATLPFSCNCLLTAESTDQVSPASKSCRRILQRERVTVTHSPKTGLQGACRSPRASTPHAWRTSLVPPALTEPDDRPQGRGGQAASSKKPVIG